MSLFKVEGWKLPEKIAVGTSKNKERRDQNKKLKEQLKEKFEKKPIEKEEAPKEPKPDTTEKKRQYSEDEDGFIKVSSKKKKRKSKSTEVEDKIEKVEKVEKAKKVDKKEAEPKTEDEVKPEESKQSKKKKKEKKEKKEQVAEKPKEEKSEPKKAVVPTPANKPKLTALQQKMMEKLSGSRFRWINEQLYTTTSEEAVKIIQEQPELFDEYHSGFRNQVKSWPQNPVDTFVSNVRFRMLKPIGAPGGIPGQRDGTVVIADMGCGEANFALELSKYQEELEQEEKKRLKGKKHAKPKKLPKFEVHSFDLKKANDRVTVADIKNVPLEDESVNVVVFCLALMGTNFLDFIKEGLRILKPNGEIWIAEIKSRFVNNDTSEFVSILKDLGLFHKTTDDTNKMFISFEFFKPNKEYIENREKKVQSKRRTFEDYEEEGESLEERRTKEPEGRWLLKPCLYKRR